MQTFKRLDARGFARLMKFGTETQWTEISLDIYDNRRCQVSPWLEELIRNCRRPSTDEVVLNDDCVIYPGDFVFNAIPEEKVFVVTLP